MDVPLEIRLSLRPGTVYYMADRALTSVQPHYFIVVNADPLGDEVLAKLQQGVIDSRLVSEADKQKIVPPTYTGTTR